jgi:predicted small metal-binding protein
MDVGVGCSFEARAPTEEEVLKIAAQHAKTDHGIDEVKQEYLTVWRRLIRNEKQQLKPEKTKRS